MRPLVHRERHQREGGFTLVELMISLTVVSIAIAAAFSMAFSLMNGFDSNRSAVQTESTARTVLDIMATGVRSASPGLAGGEIFDTCTTGLKPTLEVTNSGTAPDSIRMIHTIGGALTFITSSQDILASPLTVDDTSTFDTNLWLDAVVVDPTAEKGHLIQVFVPAGGGTTSIQTRVNPACASAPATVLADRTYGAGSFIVRAAHMTYTVQSPYLLVDPDGPGPEAPVYVADGVEDLQIAVGVDDTLDPSDIDEVGLAANDDEWHYNFAGDSAPPAASLGNWRAVRLTVVGSAFREEQNNTNYLRPGAEDRPAAATPDGIRRRTFSTTISMRNFRQRY